MWSQGIIKKLSYVSAICNQTVCSTSQLTAPLAATWCVSQSYLVLLRVSQSYLLSCAEERNSDIFSVTFPIFGYSKVWLPWHCKNLNWTEDVTKYDVVDLNRSSLMHWYAHVCVLVMASSQIYSGQHCKMSAGTHQTLLTLPGMSGHENKWHVIRNTVTSNRVQALLAKVAADKGKKAPVAVPAQSDAVEASDNPNPNTRTLLRRVIALTLTVECCWGEW